MVVAGFLLWRGRLFTTRWVLWPLMLSFPLPYIANTAGWMTAEIGRQPWMVYGLVRTSQGYSKYVSSGNSLFTLLGFMGLYSVVSVLFVLPIYRIVQRGSEAIVPASASVPITITRYGIHLVLAGCNHDRGLGHP
jgi:cytochrome d ubiquinol oxidase subunit I